MIRMMEMMKMSTAPKTWDQYPVQFPWSQHEWESDMTSDVTTHDILYENTDPMNLTNNSFWIL